MQNAEIIESEGHDATAAVGSDFAGVSAPPSGGSQQGLTKAALQPPTRCLSLFASSYAAAGPVKIIANPSVKSDSITVDELKSIFLEQATSLPDGSHVEPVLQRAGTVQDAFLKEYLDRSQAEIRVYYLGLAFTGKGFVPKEFRSDAEVVAYVAKTKGTIGFVSTGAKTQGVKILDVLPGGKKRDRVLLVRVEPEYPQTLQKLRIGGTVRLALTISPKGAVERVVLMGGNPILAEAAAKAVRQWVYAPAPKSTTLQVTIPFEPRL